jgi:hypothetical protein
MNETNYNINEFRTRDSYAEGFGRAPETDAVPPCPLCPIIPGPVTLAAMREADGGNLPRFATVDALFADLNDNDD